jgi:hypothetical protein
MPFRFPPVGVFVFLIHSWDAELWILNFFFAKNEFTIFGFAKIFKILKKNFCNFLISNSQPCFRKYFFSMQCFFRSLLSILKCKALCSTWAMCFVQLYSLFILFFFSMFYLYYIIRNDDKKLTFSAWCQNFQKTSESKWVSVSLMTTFSILFLLWYKVRLNSLTFYFNLL